MTEQRQLLQDIFPNLDIKVIDNALEVHQGDAHQAIDWLLMRVFAPLPPRPVLRQTNSTPNNITTTEEEQQKQQQKQNSHLGEVLRWHRLLKKEIKRRSKKTTDTHINKNLPQVPGRSQSQGQRLHQPLQPQFSYNANNLNAGQLYAGRRRSRSAELPIDRSVSSTLQPPQHHRPDRNSIISLVGNEFPPPSYHERHRDLVIMFYNNV